MKTLFTFAIDNMVDLITNSSSELFIIDGNSKEQVIDMISNVYPDWRDEYSDVVGINDISDDDLDTYLDYTYSTGWGPNKNDLILSKTFEVDPEIFYTNFDTHDTENYWCGQISNIGYREVRRKLPKNMYFLFSIDENPNWEYQEKLSDIGIRYHLG